MAFLASTAMSMWSSRKASKAQEAQARHQQMLLNMKADEMARRSAENLALFEVQGRSQISKLRGELTGGRYGRVGEVTEQNQVDYSFATMFKQMETQKRRDDWDVKMTRMGADAAGQQAEDIGKARFWNTLSQGAGAVMQFGMMEKQGYFDSGSTSKVSRKPAF